MTDALPQAGAHEVSRAAVPNGSADPHTQELRERILWIIRLRWVAAAGVAATVWSVPRLFGMQLAAVPLYLVTAGLALYNGALWAAAHRAPRATLGPGLHWFANLQISADLVFLTALLHFSGGIENPFVCYFVFHTVIASILLSRRATYCQVGLAMILILSMAALEWSGVLQHYHLWGFMAEELYQTREVVLSVAVVSGTTLGLVAFMATSITGRLRQREAEIVRLSAALGERARELERAYDQLERVEKGKSQYMHRVSHSLRSPLAAVERMLAVISEGRTGQVSEKARELVERARRRLCHLLDLARDLLVLSRAREARPTTEDETVDLVQMANSVASEFAQQCESASVSLAVESRSGPLSVSGDPASLADLLDNLVSNAVKYTPPGGAVRIDLQRRGQCVEICVVDSGVGIPAEERGRIFDEFYRASNARERGTDGTGLGLSIVKATAESHGGSVSVESEEGAGSTFRVLLPAAVAADGSGD